MSAKGYICSSKTKQRIYRVAADLFLKNGYQNTTLSDIAKKAEVSTGTLYRYYPSKGDFLTEIGKNSVEHLRAFADDLPEDMPASEAVLAVLLEDIRGTQGIFFSPEGAEDVTELQANDIPTLRGHLGAQQVRLDHCARGRSHCSSLLARDGGLTGGRADRRRGHGAVLR